VDLALAVNAPNCPLRVLPVSGRERLDRGLVLSPPRHAGPVHSLERLLDPVASAELVHRSPALFERSIVVDYQVSADAQSRIARARAA